MGLMLFFVCFGCATSRFLKSIFSTTQSTEQHDKRDFLGILQDGTSLQNCSSVNDALITKTASFVKKYPSIKLQKQTRSDYFIKNQSKTDVDQIQKISAFLLKQRRYFISKVKS
ncbi:MAG: hypothetical protein IPH29_01950 [Candidatus Microthrix sp.]|nr:hypothetical protein [Candidatus Microthrix sp.]